LRSAQLSSQASRSIRAFASSSRLNDEAAVETTSPTVEYNPATVTSKKGEKALIRSGVLPIGSRRRRAALQTSDNIPFELLPYQCFQEARKVLHADREEKLQAIQKERLKISNLLAQDPSKVHGGEKQKELRLSSMRNHLQWLKIQADINDPLIKKRFEDGLGMYHVDCSFKTRAYTFCRRYEQTYIPLLGR
jgi:large subunit ribosomal protein L35